MKLPAKIEKWGSGVLGVVFLLLVVNLVMEIRGTHAGNTRAHIVAPRTTRARILKAAARGADDLAKYDPVVHVEILKELDARPLPDLDRNIFDFVTPPAPVVTPLQVATVQPVVLPPPPPPPPPPVLLKPVGYNGMPGGGKSALTTLDDQVYVVREGDVVASRYTILKITPTYVTVDDATTHQTVDLPYPQ